MPPQPQPANLSPDRSRTLLGSLQKLVLSSALLQISTIVSGILAARILGPEGRGVYGEMLLYTHLFFTLTCLSLADGAIYTVPEEKLNHRRFLPSLLPIFFLLGLLCTSSIFGFYFLGIIDENFRWGLALITATWFVYALEVSFTSLEKVRMNFKWVSLFQSGGPALFSLLLLYIYILGLDVSAYSIVFLFLSTKLVFIVIFVVLRWSDLSAKSDIDFAKKSFARGGRLHVALVVSTLVTVGDKFVLSLVGSDQLLGYYFVAYSVAGFGIGIISAVIMNMVFPALVAADASERKNEVVFFLRITAILSFAPIPPLLLCLPLIIPVVYGQAFQASADMVVWLTLALALNPLKLVIVEIIRSSSRIRQVASINLVYVSCFSILSIYNIEEMSLNFFIFSIGASSLMSILIGMFFLKRNGDLDTLLDVIPSYIDFQKVCLMLRSAIRR